jgi:hypothetical protein
VEGDLGMRKRFWSIFIVTCAVLLSSSTLVNAEPRKIDSGFLDHSNFELRSNRGTLLPAVPIIPASSSEPGDDDAPNKDGGWNENPELDNGKGFDRIGLRSFKSLGTGIRMHLLKYRSALR